jgi:predicted HicB family RNase H-like nuclease
VKKIQIIVRATPEFKRQVARAARHKKVTINQLVIDSLTRTLKKQEGR